MEGQRGGHCRHCGWQVQGRAPSAEDTTDLASEGARDLVAEILVDLVRHGLQKVDYLNGRSRPSEWLCAWVRNKLSHIRDTPASNQVAAWARGQAP
jgi:hypothetical protein